MKKQKANPLILSLAIITLYPLLAYFIFIPFLGFYNDDWIFGYFGHFYKPISLIKMFNEERPLMGYFYAFNHVLLNNNVLFWHIYMFIVKITGGYFLFFLLRKLWPNRLALITAISVLFLIYPGYLQQTVPIGNQNYITLPTLWIISLFLTVISIKSRNKFNMFLSIMIAVILQIITISFLEFFLGVEFLRILIIFYLLKVKKISFFSLKKTFIYWSPYVITLVIFLLWRILMFKGQRENTDISWLMHTYYQNPIWVAEIPLKVIYSWISTVILPYFIPLAFRFIRIPLEKALILILLGAMSSLFFFQYYKSIVKSLADESFNNLSATKRLGKTIMLIGIVSTFIALIPVVMTGRYVSQTDVLLFFNRFSVSSIIGVTFIIAGFLLYKTRSSIQKTSIIFLIALSMITQFINGYDFVLDWQKQKDTWWQLYWRASRIQNNALLVFDFPKILDKDEFQDKTTSIYRTLLLDDYQLWAAGNFFFNYNNSSQDYFSGQYLINNNVAQKIKDDAIEAVRTDSADIIKHTRNYNNTIIISLPTNNSCLWVFDKDREELPDNVSDLAKSNIAYSDINKLVQINAVPAVPPVQIFGHEPSRNWCYYFQKASLARQFKEWNKLNLLTEEVLKLDLKPKDINEWLPFIEGLIIGKKNNEAQTLIKNASSQHSQLFTDNLCKMLKRLNATEFEKDCPYEKAKE